MADTNTKKRCMLTTVDNPYSPFDQFDQWFQFDQDKGYCTCSLIARVAFTSDQLTDEENAREMERAIDKIIRLDFQMIYRKVWADEESVLDQQTDRQ